MRTRAAIVILQIDIAIHIERYVKRVTRRPIARLCSIAHRLVRCLTVTKEIITLALADERDLFVLITVVQHHTLQIVSDR